jgi:acyl-CoA thioester hydrolase
MNEKHAPYCEIERRVAFYELDPMQIVWHGNYYKFYEDARRALFARHGIDLNEVYQRTHLLFPIVRATSKHIFPLRYNDEFICKATLTEARMRLTLDFEIRLKVGGKICTRGRTEQVTVKAPEMEIIYEIPEEIRRAFAFD